MKDTACWCAALAMLARLPKDGAIMALGATGGPMARRHDRSTDELAESATCWFCGQTFTPEESPWRIDETRFRCPACSSATDFRKRDPDADVA
ncbi:hypothetical protein [Halorhabdus amylolytica]|uniref:hypothetical protein n=1 Tax=Halorhabdus amylolytica TaxID=2559573 RepID=UPI0010AA999B|nr:hypothetical protein [Halorhabdus amylolytica]